MPLRKYHKAQPAGQRADGIIVGGRPLEGNNSDHLPGGVVIVLAICYRRKKFLGFVHPIAGCRPSHPVRRLGGREKQEKSGITDIIWVDIPDTGR